MNRYFLSLHAVNRHTINPVTNQYSNTTYVTAIITFERSDKKKKKIMFKNSIITFTFLDV